MSPNNEREDKSGAGARAVVAERTPRQFAEYFTGDGITVYAVGALLALILIGTIWQNRFLPMQDYPQHLFMAVVANTYDDPAFNWQEHFELRNQFGPYRGAYLAMRGLSYVTDPATCGQIMATVYVLLVALVAFRVARADGTHVPRWGALLFFPLCLHPMYFYGFINYFISIPVLILALLDIKPLLSGPLHAKAVGRQALWQVLLFLLHPYTLLVFVVLAFVTALLLGQDRRQLLRGLGVATCALLLFLGAVGYESTLPASSTSTVQRGTPPEWWPLSWDLQFLVLHFTGMRVTRDPNWFVSALWGTVLALVLWEAWRRKGSFEFDLWFPVMFLLALAGYFVLPFRIYSDDHYTFFNARMLPILFFLLVPIVASIPIGRAPGRVLAGLCLLLTIFSANMHDRVAREVADFVKIVEPMDKNAAVLQLVGNSPSTNLDRFFYANFQICFPFYYHILKGGGVNAFMFDRRLMPVGFREGKKPGEPPFGAHDQWVDFRGEYDYLLVHNIPSEARKQLDEYGQFLSFTGRWTLYKVRK